MKGVVIEMSQLTETHIDLELLPSDDGKKQNARLRNDFVRFVPSKLCPGCGHGIVLNTFVRALDELIEGGFLEKKDIVAVSGIGCSGWITSPHLKADTFHTTHGRTLAFATGMKVANPNLKIFVFTGDGDGTAIGLSHLLHAARRNIDVNVILVNNRIYGMTSGQVAPTTPHDARTVVTPQGNPEYPFDIAQLVAAAGATYVARWTVAHPLQVKRSIIEAYKNKGFSFIEILTTCPTYYGKYNPPRNAYRMIQELKDMTSRNDPNKIKIGVIAKSNREEFVELLKKHKTVKG